VEKTEKEKFLAQGGRRNERGKDLVTWVVTNSRLIELETFRVRKNMQIRR
jgi:hypothetical protein